MNVGFGRKKGLGGRRSCHGGHPVRFRSIDMVEDGTGGAISGQVVQKGQDSPGFCAFMVRPGRKESQGC